MEDRYRVKPSFDPPRPPGSAVPVPAAPPRIDRAHRETSVKETIESILIAFVLAFVFRAFVVEAFVIPTGSMAPTLLGAHVRYRCPQCGYEYTNNVQGQPRGNDLVFEDRAKAHVGTCPNCGYQITGADPTAVVEDTVNQPGGPAVHFGDRILVLKYAYLFREPKRWDVIVFKSPDPPGNLASIDQYDYGQNYIKRLIGRPGERVFVADGDVYVYAGDKPAGTERPEDFAVQTKPRDAQEALWRVVYDNDYHPAKAFMLPDQTTWRQPWTRGAGGGWDLDAGQGGRTFAFDNAGGRGAIAFDGTANLRGRFENNLNDWVAYDAEIYGADGARLNPVGDVKLALTYTRQSGDGPLRLRLTKRGDAFVAEFTPAGVRLLHARGGGPEVQVGATAPAPHAGRAARIEFANVDYEVSVRVDGTDVIRTTPDDYRPDVAAVVSEASGRGPRPPYPAIEVSAERQSARVEHLSLWRDVYYLSRGYRMLRAMPDRFPDLIVRLGPDEYFPMGDNSAVSQDGRYWANPVHLPQERLDAQAGVVPGRFLLGKAFFVYWPAGYKPFDAAPGLAPNFGAMRFIH